MGRALASRTIVVTSCILAASIAACVDFGDLSGDDGGAATNDGGSSDAPANGDASVDGTVPTDGGATLEAQSEAAAPFVSCAALSPQPALCADFDEGSLTGNAFTSTSGAVSLDSTSAVSGSHSLLAQFGSGAQAFVRRDTLDASFPTNQHLSFDFFPGGPSSGAPSSAGVASWYVDESGSGCSLGIDWTPAKMSLSALKAAGSEFSELDFTITPRAGEWSRIDLTLSLGTSGITASAAVNGQFAGSTIISCSGMGDAPENFSVSLQSADAGSLRFDNVVFEGN